MKLCPFCKEQVQEEAIKCRHCHSMLLPGLNPEAAAPAAVGAPGKVTYVVDEGIVKFGKFAGAVLGLFLVVGTYLFNIKLEVTIERMREAQKELQDSQTKLAELKATAAAVEGEVESARKDVQGLLAEIVGYRNESVILITELRVRQLSPDQKASLDQARREEPDRFRRGASEAKLWPIGSTVRIRFLAGSAQQKEKFRQAMAEWQTHINLKIEYSEHPESEVKVGFQRNLGSWSFAGTDAVAIKGNEPSINLGFDEPQAIPASYLHEIGHMLGLIHEVKNPRASLKWDREAMYTAFQGAPNFWNKANVDRNFFSPETYPGSRPFDPDSIMMMAFPPEYFTDKKGFSAPSTLSDSDKRYVASLYPK